MSKSYSQSFLQSRINSPFKVNFASCCRIAEINNNPSQSFDVFSYVHPKAPAGPKLTMNPIVTMSKSVQTQVVPIASSVMRTPGSTASELPSVGNLRYSFTPASENWASSTNQNGDSSAYNMQISTDGYLRWVTNNYRTSYNRYSVSVLITDALWNTRMTADFMVFVGELDGGKAAGLCVSARRSKVVDRSNVAFDSRHRLNPHPTSGPEPSKFCTSQCYPQSSGGTEGLTCTSDSNCYGGSNALCSGASSCSGCGCVTDASPYFAAFAGELCTETDVNNCDTSTKTITAYLGEELTFFVEARDINPNQQVTVTTNGIQSAQGA